MYILEAFESIENKLPEVLPVVGCREGWIQAELYRYFVKLDGEFSVNSFQLAARSRADLHGYIPVEWIAELKVLGSRGYFNKNITGRCDISAFLPKKLGARVKVSENHFGQVNVRKGSLLKDYLRLRACARSVDKYVVLVIHKNGEPDQLGVAIKSLCLPGKEWTMDRPDFMVRVWKV